MEKIKNDKKQKVFAIAGTGYVGMSMAVLLSQKHHVIAFDIVKDKVDKINNKISPIQDDLVIEYLQNSKLHLEATIDSNYAYRKADYVIIATPTNYDETKNYFDTSSVENVIHQVARVNPKATIVIKSTIPVGYTHYVCKKYPNLCIIFCPEFLRESKALYDNLYPSRIIVGCEERYRDEARFFARALKDCSLNPDVIMLFMGPAEAESVKLFSNTYLALRVSFFNELDTYSELKSLDSSQIIKGVCLDPRIGDYYNNPSFGYGGYCLPKDTKQLLANYQDVPENLISAIVQSNITRKEFIASSIYERAKINSTCKCGENLLVGIFRLTMKSNSDNYRESAIQSVMQLLETKGVEIVVYEPTLENTHYFEGFRVINDFDEFVQISDVIVANRYEDCLEKVKCKVYTRDLFGRD